MRQTSEAGAAPAREASYPSPPESRMARGDATRAPGADGPAGSADGRLAITAIACRLPGAPDTEAFWDLLAAGRHAIGRLPEDRWSSAKFLRKGGPARGRTYTNAAGVIDDLWDFDAGFFGLSPREAAQMDPQQRMMLEVAWQAVEAALPLGGALGAPGRPGGFGRTGVYVGASTMDHAQRFATDIASIDTPFMTGNTLSIISNRLSQTFGFEGPSLTVDTACASGLTALHLAAEALRSGEIDTAVVGAVNALLQPWNFVGFSQATMLSPSGLCRAFDAGADGYVRAEGAVALVLRRHRDAVAGGEPLRGVLRASGTSADGLKPGLSRPDAGGQAALLARVHAAAGLPADRLAFLEAHGTGTPVGDPVEAAAIISALGGAREAAGLAPLPIGSAKSNVGHLEPAAGLVGVLKALMALERGYLPPTLHVDRVNPAVDRFEGLAVAQEARALPPRADGAPHAAGVSAFGFGGANAHVVLEAASPPDPVSPPVVDGECQPGMEGAVLPPLVLSADTEAGLKRLAGAWRERLAGLQGGAAEGEAALAACETVLPALLAASGQRASLRRERAVIMGETPAGLDAALGALADADGEALETVRCAAVLRGSAAAVAAMPGGDSPHTGGVCDGGSMPGVPVGFLFAGNGAQWAGMGEALWATDAAYAAGFERASAALAAAGGSDPRALRKDPSLGDRLTESGPAQAFLFALQVGLVDALAAAGMRPAAVLGHSVGEVTAAWAAGALALADAARIIALRAEAVAPLHGQGTMAALLSSPEEAASLIEAAGLSGQVGVAALNSPRSVTVSGSVDGIDALGRQARQARLAMRKLPVPYPYHNAEMALIRAPLMAGLATLEPCHAEAAVLYSSVSGGRLAGPEDVTAAPLDAEHWWRNAREPVQFWPAAEAMVASGVGYLVEIGPRPVLTGYLRALRRPGCDQVVTCVAAMEGPGREGPAPRSLAAAGLASGAAISRDFLGPLRAAPGHVPAAGCAAPRPGTRPDTPLPRTPLTRSRYQAALGPEAIDLFGLAAEAEAEGSGDHPAAAPGLLGLRDRPGAGPWHARLDPTLHPWIADHRVDGHAVLPAAAFAAIALAAGREVGKSDIVEIEGLDILAPLQVPDDGVDLRTSLDAHRGALVIESRPQGSALPFRAHARATLRRTPAPGAGVALAEALASRAREAADTRGGAAPDAGTEELRIPAAALYEALSRSGLDYGPHFRLLHGSAAVSRCDDGAARVSGLVRAAPPEGLDGSGGVEAAREAFRGTLPPMLLDACFHVLAALLTPAEARSTWLPVRIARLWLAEAMPEAAEDWHVTARFRTRRAAWLSADVSVADANGTPFLAIEGLGLEARALPGLSGLEDWAEAWVPLAPPPRGETGEDPGRTGPLAPAGQTPRKPARPLAALLEEAGHWRDIEPSPDAALLLEELCKHAIADVLGPSPQAAVQPSLGDEALRAMLTARLRADAKAAASADGGAPENAGLADHLAPVAGIIDRLLSHHNGCSAALQGALALPEALRHALAEIRPDGAEPEGGPRPAMPLSQEAALAPLLRVLEGVVGDAVPVRLEKPEGPGHPSLGHAAWVMNGADKTADPATCSIWVVSSEGALAPDLAVPASLSSGDVLAVVTPAIGSMFAEEPAAHALATHLEREGFADVRVGWFDAGTHVLALVAARGLGETAAGMPDQPPLQELSPPAGDPAAFLLLHDPGRTGQVAAMALSARWPGAEVRSLASPGCVSGREVVVLPPVPETPAGARACIGRRIALGRAFLRHLAEDKQAAPRGLTFFASPSEGAPAGSASVGAVDDALGARQAAVAMASGALDGFVRTLVNEAPSLPVRMVTTDDDAAALEALAAMPPAAEEPLLALVGNAWAVPRVARREIGPAAGPRRLATRLPGALDSLHWEPAAMPRPGPGEVLIAVEAAGLNFRDVMWAQRRLPAEALELGHAGAQLGMECAGRVVAVGPDHGDDVHEAAGAEAASAVQVGDRVLALAAGAMATHVTTDRRLVVRLPDNLSMAAGAAIAVTGLTARYALRDLARLSAGETLLLHGAAGGVGLAALGLARRLGAEVIATAGTPAKRRLVQALGATAAVDSRSPDFADEVRALTGGRGCDVVLNSLAGEGQLRSLGCLAPFGRFVEIGKRDIFENAALPLRPFAHNLSFFAFDADQLLAVRPGRVVSLLEETVADHAEGLLPLPPLSLMEAEDPAAAFRVLQRAGHMGKIVLKTPACAEGLEARGPERSPPPREVSAAKGAHDGGDWLLIGGTGGLGRSIAARLAERGAGRIWLVGRRAVPAGSAVETLMAGRAGGGAKIIQRSLDAGDEAALAALLEEIAAAPRPAGAPVLEGIVHAAMVLDDAPLAAMTPERVDRVLAAKTDTALLLDRLTRPLAPRHFVLLGSVAARLGNPGQSAYAAANAGLEALARCRRAAGLPAVALALGPVGDAGHLAAAPERAARIGDSVAHALGSRLLRCSEVLAAFEAALDNPAMPPCCAVMPAGAQLDPAALPIARLPLQARLARKASAAGDLPVEALQTAAAIAALPPDKAPEAIADIIRASLARILRMPAEDVLDTRPLTEMGLDSLMALDLKSTLEDRHGLAVPVAAIGAETTLTGLAGTLAAGLARPEGDHRGGNIGGAGPQPNDPAARGTERAGLAEGDGRSDAAMAASLSSAHAAGLPDELRAELARRLASPRPQGGDTGQRARGSSRMAAGKRAAAR